MENASKALIIAASILLAILVISMGVRIFNNAQNSYNDSNFDTAEINMFNSKFERYDNERLGSQVKSLISFAISNASTNKDEPSKLPTIILNGEEAKYNSEASNPIDTYIDTLSTMRGKVKTTSYYKVELNYGKTGLIDKITINDG